MLPQNSNLMRKKKANPTPKFKQHYNEETYLLALETENSCLVGGDCGMPRQELDVPFRSLPALISAPHELRPKQPPVTCMFPS